MVNLGKLKKNICSTTTAFPDACAQVKWKCEWLLWVEQININILSKLDLNWWVKIKCQWYQIKGNLAMTSQRVSTGGTHTCYQI
jgi:hypothetical protein